MYLKNWSTPAPIQAKVTAAADGEPITTGVVAYHVVEATRVAVEGLPAEHVANGLWTYTPTQAETNYSQFSIEFYHADAVADGPVVEVVTWDSTQAQAAAAAAITAADIPAGVVAAIGNGSALTEAGGTGDQFTAVASATNLATANTVLSKIAPRLIGTLSGAGTGTEVCVYSGTTVTYTVDSSGNITNVVFS